jgi:XTP/dITP diphosphohydrolase
VPIKKAERLAAAGGEAPSVLDGVAFGSCCGGPCGADAPIDLGAHGLGDELMRLVAQARAAGFDPELELRPATRHFADRVRDVERADGVG